MRLSTRIKAICHASILPMTFEVVILYYATALSPIYGK
jgi:hypothetical protein